MTNPSETRDSELALNLRADASLLADMFSGKPPPQTGAIIDRLREAADTIDRLTSTGEAVGWRWPHTNGGWNYWWGPTPPPYADRLEVKPQPLYTHASPREGHVEVPVEPLVTDAEIEKVRTADYRSIYGEELMGRMAKELAAYRALPHNQGETKP